MDFTIPTPTASEPSNTLSLIKAIGLESHPEGGYYKLTQTHPLNIPLSALIPSPPEVSIPSPPKNTGSKEEEIRAACTSIFYFMSPHSPIGHFHRNKSVIIHSLHRGRGRYVLIHEDGRVESFIVGNRVEKGERCMWVVDGGVWKASFFEEDPDEGKETNV